MATQFQKRVKAILNNTPEVTPDLVVCHKDGTVSIKRCYFYRSGMDDEKWGNRVMMALDDIAVLVKTVDDFELWPKTSYFVAVVKAK